MLRVDDSLKIKDVLLKESAVYLFVIGFEERCLSFPRYLAQFQPNANNVYFALDPGDVGVSWLLRAKRSDHWAELRTLFPAIQSLAVDDIEDLSADGLLPVNHCVDLSSMPRWIIFRLLKALSEEKRKESRFFVIYSYPATYSYGKLETPSVNIELLFDRPKIARKRRCAAIFLPGFDRSYTDLATTHLRASSGNDVISRYLFGFPGRQFTFYQRSLEAHLELLKGANLLLLPQDHILLAFTSIRNEIIRLQKNQVYVVPQGSRVSSVAVFLAATWSRRHKAKVNILHIHSESYSTLRSEGAQAPMIEEIPARLLYG